MSIITYKRRIFMNNNQVGRILRNFFKKMVMMIASGTLLSMIWGLYLAPTAVSAAPEETITITAVWIGGQQNTILSKLAQVFEETHPNVKFDKTVMEQSQFLATQRSLMSHAGGPDITWMNYGSGLVEPLSEMNALENLDRYYEKYGWWNFLSEGYRTHLVDGSMYNVSLASFLCPMIFYNKTIFNEVGVGIPRTLEELYTISDKLRSKGYEPLALGDRDSWLGHIQYQAIVTRTVPLEDYEKVLYFTRREYHMADYPGFTEAFQIMRDMEEKKVWATGVLAMGNAEAEQLFMVGRSAMFAGGSWGIDTMREAFGDDADFFLYPQIKKDIPIPLTRSYGDEFVLSAFATPEVKDMVAEFFDFTMLSFFQKAT